MGRKKNDQYLNNNENLPIKVEIEYTPEQIDEMRKCREDIIYFAENFFFIKVLGKGRQKIKLHDIQRKLITTIVNNQNTIICASRQTGKSTLMTIVCLWYALFQKDKEVAILANKEVQAKEILDRIKLAYEEIPNYIKAGVWTFSQEIIRLTNGSKIYVSTTSATSLRGRSVDVLFVDEFAFVPAEIAEAFFKSVVPVLCSGPDSKMIITSCVTDDTIVYTDEGMKSVKSFIDKDKKGFYDVPSYRVSGFKDDDNEGTLMFNNGEAEVLQLRSQSTSLKCSKTHKLFAYKDGQFQWVEAGNLTTDDYISVKYGMEKWGNFNDLHSFKPTILKKLKYNYNITEMSSDFCYFLGLFIAEGSVYKQYNKHKQCTGGIITITCGDDISDILNNLGFKFYKNKDGFHYNITSKYLIELFEFLGFDLNLKAKNKIIPEKLLGLSRENMAALLQGMFDGDGTASGSKVGYTSANLSLINQIRSILMNFGILSLYGTALTPPSQKVKVSSRRHTIELNGVYSKLFFEQIGFRFSRKQKYYNDIKDKDFSRPNVHDIIPLDRELLRSDFNKIKKKHIPVAIRTCMYTKENIPNFSRQSLLKFKELIGGQFSEEMLNDVVKSDIKWEKISNITSLGVQPVYDFSLKDVNYDDPNDWAHSVLYNGVVGHQTPNGIGNKFHELFSNAENGRSNTWAWDKMYWYQIPGRDEAWKAKQLDMIGYDMQMWNQEFEIMFLEDGQSAINLEVIERLKKFCRPPDHSFDGGEYKIWYPAEPDHIYVFGVDVAEGVGQDWSVVQILDITDPTNILHAGQYAVNYIQPFVFAEKLNQIARAWGRPFLCVESNKEGSQVLDALINIHHYDNIVTYTMKNDKRGYYQKPGIFCHQNSKYTGIMNFKYFIEHLEVVKIFDLATLKEFETFVRKENKTWTAQKGRHDDRVMSMIWALFILEKEIAEQYLNVLEYDDTGKPCRISDPNQDLANMSFYEPDSYSSYAKKGGNPMPVIFQIGGGVIQEQNFELEQLSINGWTFA